MNDENTTIIEEQNNDDGLLKLSELIAEIILKDIDLGAE